LNSFGEATRSKFLVGNGGIGNYTSDSIV